jgi:arylsulfatase A-like enzyme
VYDGLIRVPLVVVGASGQKAGVRRDDPVRLIDVLPTLCELAGAPAQDGPLEGADVFARDRTRGLPGFASYAEAPHGFAPYSVRRDGGLLITNDVTKTWEFYDLETDPFEMTNLWKDRQNDLGDMRADLRRLREGLGVIEKPEPAALDDRTVESLKSLGY